MPVSASKSAGSADSGIAELREFFDCHPKLAVLTGAGVSTASGIPDYRDEQGDWKRPQPVFFQEFMKKEATRKRYWARSFAGWDTVATARPGAAHLALAKLEKRGAISALITQNVDGLHQAAGSRRVHDLHGRIDRIVCMACAQVFRRQAFQARLRAANPAWRFGGGARAAPDGDADLGAVDFSAFNVPACGACGGVLKPDVVFFGEAVPKQSVHAVIAQIEAADGLLVVGSSLMVYSGFRFARETVSKGKPLAILNIGHTRADNLAHIKVQQDCGYVLQAIAKT